MSHPKEGLFISSLKSENPVMMKAWIDGQEEVDIELLKSCTKFLELRILRQDEVAAWCVKKIADLAPGLFLNSRFDTTSMILARHAKDEFIEKYQQEISHLLQQPQERYLTNDEGETALFIALEEGREAIIRTILKEGCDINHISLANKTIIDKATQGSHANSTVTFIVDWLEKHNQISSLLDKELRNLFYDCLLANNRDLMEKLRPFAGDLDIEMSKAISEGRADAVEELLKMGADPKGNGEFSWKDVARKNNQGRILGILALAENRL